MREHFAVGTFLSKRLRAIPIIPVTNNKDYKTAKQVHVITTSNKLFVVVGRLA